MTSAETRTPPGETRPVSLDTHASLDVGHVPYILSGVLAVVATTAAGFSFFFPSLLTGVEVGKGNMRGTALAILVVGIPVLADPTLPDVASMSMVPVLLVLALVTAVPFGWYLRNIGRVS